MKALPFPCIRPVPEHAAEVAALPYDVFDRAEAAAYVAGHPLSFLNIDAPKRNSTLNTTCTPPRSTRAGRSCCASASRTGRSSRTRTARTTSTNSPGRGRVQTGIACVCAVDDYEQGVIKRHELTREDKERDRIEHIEALGCQTGPSSSPTATSPCWT